jgi:hypothetical protein
VRENNRLLIGASIAAMLIVGCTGCGANSSAPAESSAPVASAPRFQATWLPIATYDSSPPTAQTLKWQEPNGTTGSAPVAEVLQLRSQNPSTTINMVVVSAAAYPPGYWQTFATSTTWQHFTEAGKQIAVSPRGPGSSTVAMSEQRGYIIQLTTNGVTADDVLRIVRDIRWK